MTAALMSAAVEVANRYEESVSNDNAHMCTISARSRFVCDATKAEWIKKTHR
jgi:hypothetical protein